MLNLFAVLVGKNKKNPKMDIGTHKGDFTASCVAI